MRRLDELPLEPRERAAIEEATRILRARFPVEEIILFGSKARGDADEESDIDLLVLTARALSRAERHAVYDALFSLQLRHEVVLSPLIVQGEQWRSDLVSLLPIHDEIEEHGAVA